MPPAVKTLFSAPAGYRSAIVAEAMGMLNAQLEQLTRETRGATPEELAWQAAPGMNTIGMLLAHLATTEVHLVAVGLEGREHSDTPAVLGIGNEDDGMPLPPGGSPPAVLNGRTLDFFDDVLARGRAELERAAAAIGDADLARQITRRRPDGTERLLDVHWVFYHLVEHFAGHRGQVSLIRHLYRLRSGGKPS